MQIVKPDVLQIMRRNRQTRVLTVLSCYMSRKELFSERVEYMDKYFQSERAENLEGTDESDLFDAFIQTIEEKFQNFKENGSIERGSLKESDH